MRTFKLMFFPVIFFFLYNLQINQTIAQDRTGTENVSNHLSWLEMMQDPNVNFYQAQKVFNDYWANRTDYKGNGWKVFKRWEYINESRVLSDGRLQAPGYVKAQYDNYMSKMDGSNSASGNWTIQGPTTYVGNLTSQPTGMGRINAIAFHPTDANIIFVGSPSGGFWKTANGGTTWTNLCSNIPTLGVSSILIHPTNPDIIYIGSGDRDSQDAPGLGVFKSTDGGATWVQVNNTMGNVEVGAMIMHPSDPTIIIAATNEGIFKTTNGGVTWSLKASGNFKDIKFQPSDPTIVYAVKYITPSEFHRSSNTGDSWTQVTSGIPTAGIGLRMVIGVSPANASYVYLVQIKDQVTPNNKQFAGLLRSTDNGLNFTTRSTSPNIFDYACNGSGTASQATYDLCITVDPGNVNTIYVGSINNWKSTDGGINWTIVSHWVGSTFGTSCAASVHADQHCYEWSPLNGQLYVGHDGGISYTADGGTTWPQITNNLAITQIYKIGQYASNVNYTLFGCQDNGSMATINGGTFTTTKGGDGTECLIDYSDPNYCYNTYVQGDIGRTTSGPVSNPYSIIASTGTNGIGADEDGAWVTPYFLHRTNPTVMFAGYENVWRTTNVKASPASSVTWSAISSGETSTCRVLEQSSANPDIIYVVRSGAIKRTDNANASAGSVTWTACALPGGATPTDVKSHPTDENIVYATAGYQVYKSTNKGASWTDLSGNLPALFINCLVLDKNANEGIYIGNQTSVWYKDAAMANWILFSTGLPPVDVRELEIYYDVSVPTNNRIKAGTYGRGLWESDLAEVSVIDPTGFIANAASSSQINLAWTKNAANDDVIVAWSPTTAFGTPADGTAYSSGNSLPSGGGTVIYKGNSASFNHTSLTTATTYYYKIWSVNGSNQYSAGLPPISETTDCSAISTLPYTENFDNPTCWRSKDNTGQGSWQFGSTSNVNYTPALTAPYAYFSSEYAVTHNYSADLISPPFDLSAYPNILLQFNHLFDGSSNYPSTGTVYYSIDNGATWASLASYTIDSPNPQAVTLNVNGASGQSQVKFKWNYTCSPTGAYMWDVDDIQISDNSNYWTGTVDNDWFKPGNWSTGAIPTATTSAVIPSAPSNQPQINAAGAVCLNLTIQTGASLTMNASTAYTLSVAGDWTNNGTFTRGIGTVDFNGTNALQTIKGSSTTAFNILSVTKGAQDRILEATSLITLNAAANPLTLTSGTFKLSSASTITPFTSGPSMDASAGIWNNGGVINPGNFSWTLTGGLLRITAGTVNVGTGSGNSITYLNNGKLIIEGGTMNIAGRFSPNSGTSTGTYTQLGGVLTVNTVGSASTTRAPFEINSVVPFTMTGGTIIIQKASSNATDYINLSTTNTITGGTLQIGNAATPASQTIRINSTVPVYNLTINSTNSPTAQFVTNGLTVQNNVTISGGTLNANSLNLNVGGHWTNNGTFTPGTSTVTFNGTANQNITGSSATTFKGFTMNNSTGATLSGSVNASVDGALTLTSGIISTGGNKLIITSNGSVSRTSGHVFGNLQRTVVNGDNKFDIGTTVYAPATINMSGISGAVDLTAKTTNGNPAAGSGIIQSAKCNHYWTVTKAGGSFTSYSAVFDFTNTTNTGTPANYIVKKYDGSWASTSSSVSANTITVTGLTGFSDFEVGEQEYMLLGAADQTSNYSTWSNGSNQGCGYGVWVLSQGGNAGFFLGDPSAAGISGMTNPSFGLYANPAGSNYANADRSFIIPLVVGSTLSLDWGVNWDANGAGSKGINLYTGGTGGTQIININMGGSQAITINGNAMFNNYGNQKMTLNLKYVSTGQLRVYGTGRDGSETYDQTLAVAGPPDAIRFYAANLATGDQRQPYFNNLKIVTDPATIPANSNVFVRGCVALASDFTANNLSVESGDLLSVNPTKQLTVNGTLTNNAGTSGLVIKSDVTGTGSLIHPNSNVDGTFERFMNNADWTNASDGWHFVSSPVVTQPISPAFTVDPYDFYCWYEPDNLWVNFKNTTTSPTFLTVNGSANFTQGRGYLVDYDEEGVRSFTGKLNVSDIAVSGLTITGTNNQYRSWHLVGNPFGSALTWDATAPWSLTNIGGVAKIWNEANQSYSDLTSSPSSVIPATNGFMVQVVSGTGSLVMPAAKRVHSSQPFYKSTAEELMLKVTNLSGGNSQESRVILNPLATDGFDLMFDGEFLAGYAPQFYSVMGDTKISTNSIPVITSETMIPFGFEKNTGSNYRMDFTGTGSLKEHAFLHDLKTGVITDLSKHDDYTFSAADGDLPGRFLLKFSNVGLPGHQEPGLQAYYYQGGLNLVNGASAFNVEIFNVTGQRVFSGLTADHRLSLDLPAGIYLARVTSANQTITVKFLVKQ